MFGAVVMIAVMAIARLADVDINMPIILGTLWGGRMDVLHWLAGFLIHVGLYGGIGVLYGAAFEFITHRANWLIGALFSVIHMIGAGLFFYALPYFHPLIPEEMPNPGPFMASEGSGGVLVFIVVHLLYGIVLGHFYGRVVHRLPSENILI